MRKTFSFLSLFVFLILSWSINGCSTSSEEMTTEEPLEGSDAAQEDVDKALDDMTAGEEAGPSIDEAVPSLDAESLEQTDISDNAVSSEDVDSYKLDSKEPAMAEEAPSQESLPLEDNSSHPIAETPVSEVVAETESRTPVANVSGSDLVYMVARGESLSIIARKLMGSTKAYRDLAAHNNIKNPNRIKVGMVLNIPMNESNRTLVEAYLSHHQKTVRVKRGDSLGKIAGKVLGTRRGWKYLWKANEQTISNPHKIEVGQILNYLAVSSNRSIAKKKTGKSKSTH